MFNSKDSTSDSSVRGPGRPVLPKSDLAHHRLSPTVLSPPAGGPGPLRLPVGDPATSSIPVRPASFPRSPLNPGLRASPQPADTSKVKQTGEMLQNLMLRQPNPLGNRALPPGPGPGPGPALTPSPTPRQQPRHKPTADVTPLRRPLPPDGALPLKPRRPPSVNLKPFLRFRRGSSLPVQRQREGESCSFTDRRPVDVEANVPALPQISNISIAHLKLVNIFIKLANKHGMPEKKAT